MSTRTLPTLAAPLALFRIREGPDDQGMAHWLSIDLAAPRRLERMPYPDQHRGDFHERCRAMVAAIRCDVWALRWILGYYAARQACPGTPEVASWLLRGSHIARASLSPASDTRGGGLFDPDYPPREVAAMHSVLVIDDDDTILDLTAEIRTYAGYAVATAVDGPEGLMSAQTQRPDLVLCDIMLPSFDGLEVARRLRADPACRSVPIVLMSGAEQSTSTMSSYDAFVAKPFGLAHLLDVVGQCIAGALPPGYIGPLPLHGRRGTPWRAGLG